MAKKNVKIGDRDVTIILRKKGINATVEIYSGKVTVELIKVPDNVKWGYRNKLYSYLEKRGKVNGRTLKRFCDRAVQQLEPLRKDKRYKDEIKDGIRDGYLKVYKNAA